MSGNTLTSKVRERLRQQMDPATHHRSEWQRHAAELFRPSVLHASDRDLIREMMRG